ncbi:MAG: hypothetical protein RR704_12365 [Stenotrophomonas sp.]
MTIATWRVAHARAARATMTVALSVLQHCADCCQRGSAMSRETTTQGEERQGSQESRQDRRQDDVARQRPGQQDQQVHDEHVRKPLRKEGDADPA